MQLNEFIWEEVIEVPLEHQQIVIDRIEESRINPPGGAGLYRNCLAR